MEKEMKEQYFVQFRHIGLQPEKWFNVKLYLNLEGRYFKTYEEAKKAAQAIYEVFPDRAHRDVNYCGCIGIESYTDAKTAHDLAVAEVRIRKRWVTEWEAVE